MGSIPGSALYTRSGFTKPAISFGASSLVFRLELIDRRRASLFGILRRVINDGLQHLTLRWSREEVKLLPRNIIAISNANTTFSRTSSRILYSASGNRTTDLKPEVHVSELVDTNINMRHIYTLMLYAE